MKTGTRNAIAAIVIIALVIVGANQFGYVSLFPKLSTTDGGGGPTGGGQTIDSTMRSNYLNGIGQFEMNTKIYNSLVVATAYTVGTNLNIYYYHFLQGRWVLGVTASAGTDLFDAKPEDNGYMWVVTSVPTAQLFYVDYQKIMANDPYIVSYQYVDVDGTGVKRFAFQYDLKNHAIPSSGYPIISFTAHLIAYTAPKFADALAAVNKTVGAPLGEWYINWFLNGTANNGTAIYRIELIAGNGTVSCTDLTQIALKKLQIPGLGYLDGSSFQQSFTTQDIRWTYTVTTNFDHAIYLTLLANANNRFDMNGQLEFQLGATTEIPITLTVYYLTATGAGASISESFYATLV